MTNLDALKEIMPANQYRRELALLSASFLGLYIASDEAGYNNLLKAKEYLERLLTEATQARTYHAD